MKMNSEVLDKIVNDLPIKTWYGDGYKTDVKLILSGSALLCAYGLMDEFNDVDILVANSSKAWWSEFLYMHHLELSEFDYECVKIEYGDITYNIIRDDTYFLKVDGTPISIDGELYLDSLVHALSAKKRLNRDKDSAHFQIINQRLKTLLEI